MGAIAFVYLVVRNSIKGEEFGYKKTLVAGKGNESGGEREATG